MRRQRNGRRPKGPTVEVAGVDIQTLLSELKEILGQDVPSGSEARVLESLGTIERQLIAIQQSTSEMHHRLEPPERLRSVTEVPFAEELEGFLAWIQQLRAMRDDLERRMKPPEYRDIFK